MKYPRSFLKKSISGVSLFILVFVSVGFTPITPDAQVQKAHAFLGTGDTVTVIGGNGTVQDTISAGANTTIAGLQTSLALKELSLDPIAHALAKMILKSMTQSILNWINSGFQGSPAFVTDLKQFLLDQADALVGDFIYNDPALNFLCSPFQLDVKIALATTYQEETHEGFGSEAQCTLSGVADNIEGFLAGDSYNPQNWFEVTQNPINTPTGAYLAAEQEMYARIADAEGNTVRELDWGDGFLSFKVCSDTDVASGAQTDCDITTPGQVIADQVNKSLGAGQDALIEADEINEIIGAFFAQLAQQAITGMNGLLGLGSSEYTDTSFEGSDGRSFLDSLKDEGTEAGSIENPIGPAVTREQKHITLQKKIVTLIDDLVTYRDNTAKLNQKCVIPEVPNGLRTERANAVLAQLNSQQVLPELIALRNRFDASTDPQEQTSIINEYNKLKSRGRVVDIAENDLLKIHIDYEITQQIGTFKQQIDLLKLSCNDD